MHALLRGYSYTKRTPSLFLIHPSIRIHMSHSINQIETLRIHTHTHTHTHTHSHTHTHTHTSHTTVRWAKVDQCLLLCVLQTPFHTNCLPCTVSFYSIWQLFQFRLVPPNPLTLTLTRTLIPLTKLMASLRTVLSCTAYHVSHFIEDDLRFLHSTHWIANIEIFAFYNKISIRFS